MPSSATPSTPSFSPLSYTTLFRSKPDAVERGLVGEIVSRLERKGLRIVAMEMRQIDEAIAGRHYAEHDGKPFFGDLVAFITRSPSVDRKSTRLNSSHLGISYAVFCYAVYSQLLPSFLHDALPI